VTESGSVSSSFDSRDKLLLAALTVVLGGVLLDLGAAWWSSDHMSHGFLVPVVAYLVAAGRGRALQLTPARSETLGLVALAAALIVALGGRYLMSSLTVGGIGVVASVAALVWFRRGRAWLAALAFPLAYLLFMVPPPDEWHGPLVNWLQGWASRRSVEVLYALGVPVFLNGFVIEMADGQVEVAEACSGATSLYTLSALGVLLAFLSLTRRRTRAVLIALVLPAALIGNLARVVVTVLLCLQLGIERATSGWIHTALGLSIYVVAVGLLLAADAGLRAVERRLAGA
jgi:exosortase